MWTKKKIQKEWLNLKNPASYSGAYTFYKALKKLKKGTLSYRDVLNALEDEPIYQMHLRNKTVRLSARRHIHTRGSGLDFSADLMEMFEYNGYKYVLVMRDEFNFMIYARPLKTKDKISVKKAFKDIFDKTKIKPSTVSTDQGKEFISQAGWFKDQKILLIFRRGDNKASVSEEAISVIKHRLYRALRANYSKNWPYLLPTIVKAINETPNTGLTGLIPENIKDPVFDPVVRKRKTEREFKYPNWKEQIRNEATIAPKFPLRSCVYVTFTRNSMYKAYDFKRGTIYRVKAIDATMKPILYTLEEVDGTEIKGLKFYEEELKKAPDANDDMEYPIEDILDEKLIRGKKMYLVKYLFYPAK